MINKAVIDSMLSLPDDRLIMMLKTVGMGVGFDFGGKNIDKKTICKIRALLSELTDDDISRALYLSEKYRNGG